MEEFDFYPQKPDLVEQKPKTGLSLTIFSLVLFVMIFLFIAGDEVLFIMHLVIVLLIHELGHFIMMKLFKYKNVRMLFVPLMGAFVQGTKTNYSQKESFIVTGAGPFPGVLIGAFMVWYSSQIESDWMMTMGLMFLLLNIINLLPLDPLDGGQMFKMFMRKRHELFLMIFAFVSSVFMIGLGWFLNMYTEANGYIFMIFGFFMGFRVRALQKKYQVHKDLTEEDVNYSTTYKLLSNRDFVKIKDVLIQHTPALQKYIDQVSSDESDPVLASQVNNVLVTPLNRDASLLFKIILLLMWVGAFLTPVALFFFVDINWYLK